MITEIVNTLPKEKKIISITTDGFISNATAEEVFIATKGDLARYYGIFSREISGCESILKENIVFRQYCHGEHEAKQQLKK